MKHKKRFIFIIIVALLLFFTLAAAQAVTPGAETDPLVTLSYIEKRLTSLMSSIDQVYAKKGESGGGAVQQSLYEVIFVKAGQSLILGASSEMILRSGTATAIASFNGGLSDLTGGVDLAQDVTLIKNHLILIPRDDGRGIKAVTDCYVMVRGSHTIVQ